MGLTTLQDLTGKRFNRLVAISRAGHKCGRTAWLCKCDCGNEVITTTHSLNSKGTQSCGCYNRDNGRKKRIHGKTKDPIYRIWSGMRGRCKNPTVMGYKNYGGRGIQVCERWDDFQNFFHDMGPTYEKGLSIDRIDNNGNYEPSNCKWSDRFEQSNNRRNNRVYTIDGTTDTLAVLCRKIGIHHDIVRGRLRWGWEVEKAFKTPHI